MFSEEWPLMMFTLLSQLAIGSYLMLILIRTLLGAKNKQTAHQLTRFGLTAVGPLMGLAFIFSLFHLGTPMGAYRSIGNLGSSWLSREILTAGGFFLFWLVSYFAEKKGNSSNLLSWITALLGLMAIFSMSSIYATSIRPAWANIHTYIAFFGAALALGCAGAAALIGHSVKGQTLSPEVMAVLKKISYVAAAAVIIPLVYLPVFIGSLRGGETTAAQAAAALLTSSYLFPLILRWAISILGVLMLIKTVLGQSQGGRILPAGSILLAFSLIIVGEFIGRYIFYASSISIMIG